jgi:hypothetical protein
MLTSHFLLGSLALSLLTGSPVENEPRKATAVFTTPLAPAEHAYVLAVTNAAPMVFIPIGVSFSAGSLAWSVDAAFVFQGERDRRAIGIPTPGLTGFWFGVGPMFHLGLGPTPLGGLFVSPRVIVGGFWLTTGETMFDYLLGMDVGYQLTLGRLYLAFVAGLSGGVGLEEDDGFAGPFLVINPGGSFNANPLATNSGRGVRPVLGLNLQLLRIGFTF